MRALYPWSYMGATMSLIPVMEVKGLDPWMSQVISLKTVMNVLIVTNRTPASTSRRARRQHCPNRVMPYRSRTFRGSLERSNAFRARSLVMSRNAVLKLVSMSSAFSLASNRLTDSSTMSRSLRRRDTRASPISLGGRRSGTLKFFFDGSAFRTNGSWAFPRNPASWPCGMLPPVGPIGCGRMMWAGISFREPRRNVSALPTCGVLIPPVKSRPVWSIWWPVSCTAAAVW